MFISSVDMTNYRCYKSQKLEFADGVNIVIGKNGTGKTSLLSAIALVLSNMINQLGGGFEANITQEDVNMDITTSGESTYNIQYNYPVQINGIITSPDMISISAELSKKEGQGITIRNYGEKDVILNASKGFYPLFSYQKFDREWKAPKIYKNGQVTVDTSISDRMDGYKGCLYGKNIEERIQQWCLKMSIMEFEKKGTIQEFKVFQDIIYRFMRVMEGEDKHFKVHYSMKISGLMYEDDTTSIPLYELSTGYKALLYMIMELAYRAVLLNPSINKMEELTGIVLIDEIDAHLHPEWQWKVIEALRHVFPNVQFIIATHSPIIISSAKDSKIISFDTDGNLATVDSAYGYSIGDVLSLRQGSNDMPEESRRILRQLENAMDANDMQLASQVIAEAKKIYGEQSAFYHEVKQYYELNSLVGE